MQVVTLATSAKLEQFLGITLANGAKAFVVVTDDDFLSPRTLHDLRNAAARVRALVTLVEHGYKFDDSDAAGNIDLLKGAYETLNDALDQMASLFSPTPETVSRSA